MNIILVGMPASGKSTVGVVLAKLLGFDYVDTDILIQRSQGKCLEHIIAEKGMEAAEPRIFELLDKAYDLLNTPDVTHDGYYAFVCEKCAPTFAYYGYFMDAEELTKRAEAIYAGN